MMRFPPLPKETKWITKAGALLGLLISTIGMLPGLTANCIDRLRADKFERNFDWNCMYGELTGKFTYSYAAQGSIAFRTNGMCALGYEVRRMTRQ